MRRVVAALGVVAVLSVAPAAEASLARCKEVRRAAAAQGIRRPKEPAKLVKMLQSRNDVRADLAYCTLATLGAPAVGPLLERVEARGPFAGAAWESPFSSIVIGPPSRGLVALYLVEAILTGAPGERLLAPRPVPRLIHAEVEDQAALLALAAPLYRAWWAANGATPLDQLRGARSHPLNGALVTWL
jgi:hypothetical protein